MRQAYSGNSTILFPIMYGSWANAYATGQFRLAETGEFAKVPDTAAYGSCVQHHLRPSIAVSSRLTKTLNRSNSLNRRPNGNEARASHFARAWQDQWPVGKLFRQRPLDRRARRRGHRLAVGERFAGQRLEEADRQLGAGAPE